MATRDGMIEAALKVATETKDLVLGPGVLSGVPDVLRRNFGSNAGAVVVADPNTFAAAGRRVTDFLRGAGVRTDEPIVLDDPDLHAEMPHVRKIEEALRRTEAGTVPVAVGSGTINDMTKLAAHRLERAYLSVATAASMDGYTAYGASITSEGSKETFACPAPRALVADMEVLAAAPGRLNAAGYGDLAAKITAGADWMLADALGVEPVDPEAWALCQDRLREWLGDPAGIRGGKHAAIRNLIEGLCLTGFAMQRTRSSRPVSGSDHLFSHLWDMQGHTHNGHAPFHGYKTGIGTIAATVLYEELYDRIPSRIDVEAAVAAWPEPSAVPALVERTHARPDLRRVAMRELGAKHPDRTALRARLTRIADVWPGLVPRLRKQLIPPRELQHMLRAVGGPADPAEIGIDRPRLRRSYVEAQQIRRRYTVLDLAAETHLMSGCLERLFGGQGFWGKTE